MILDTRAEADHYMWQAGMTRRKRGEPPIALAELAKELAIKKEKIQRLEKSKNLLQSRLDLNDYVVEESDLEEYEELLNSDYEAQSSDDGKYPHETHITSGKQTEIISIRSIGK